MIWRKYFVDGTHEEGSDISSNGRILHRDDGPAVICYDDAGIQIEEWYYQNGVFHREDGPAVITRFDSGLISFEEWYIEGKEHRLDGPALISYDRNGQVVDEIWYVCGNHVEYDEIRNEGMDPSNPDHQCAIRLKWGS